MEGEALPCFSPLFDVLRFAVEDTTFTCRVLYSQCTNYQTFLKRWSVSEDEVEQCTCKPCFEEPEDLVSDIVGVVEKARATRSRNSKNSKNSILNDNKSECSSHTSKSSTSRCKSRQSLEKHSNISKIGPNTGNNHEKIEPNSLNVKSNTFTKLRRSHGFQTTYQKDFSTKKLYFKPQLNVKSNKVLIKHTKSSQILSEKSVEYLLKVTSNASTSSSKVKPTPEYETKTVCKLHSSVNTKPMYNSLKEAINVHGVPSELLKLLLTFNQYSNLNNVEKVQQRKSGMSYLQKLNEMNEQNWNVSSSEPIVNVFSQYITVLKRTLLSKRSDFHENYFVELEEKLVYLGKIYLKVFDMDVSPQNDTLSSKRKSIRENAETNMQIQRACAGIWKRNYSVSGLESSLFLSYNSKEDCKVFQKKIQKIQRMYLQMEILLALNKYVFPSVSSIDDEHVIIPQLYKTCSALCDILSLSLPVILKL